MLWRLEDTPEQAEFRERFRGWLREVLPADWIAALESGDDEAYAEARRRAEQSGWNPLTWMRTIGESGFAAPTWPIAYGGLGAPNWSIRIVREELERHRLPTVGTNLLGVGLAGPTLIEHGTEKQKEKHLRRILTGEEIWCQLFSEPGAGSDLASLSTRATRDGDEWVVTGQKVWTSIAQLAHYGMLLARTDPTVPKHEGLTWFILDMRSTGVEVRPLRQMTGSAEFNEVFLEGVRIPDSDRVGAVGEGWRVARTTLMNERVALAGVTLDNVALMGGVRKDPWQSYLDQFPDRSGAVTRQRLVDVWIRQQAKEITSHRAAAARNRGSQPGPEGAIGKVFNAELNQDRTELVVDAHGPSGVAWEASDSDAVQRAHAFLRSRANSIEGGTSEVLRNQIAERILGLPREPDPYKGVPFQDLPRG